MTKAAIEETTTTPADEAPASEVKTPAKRETKAKSEPPPHPEDEAIRFMLSVHGAGLEAELTDAIDKLQARLNHNVEHRRNSPTLRESKHLKAFIVDVTQYIRRRRGLEERRDRVRLMLNPRATMASSGKHVAEEVKELVLRVWGPEAAPLLRKIQAEIEANVRGRLAKTEEKLAKLLEPSRRFRDVNGDRAKRVAGLPNSAEATLYHEAIMEEASKHLAARKADENRLARLTQDQSLACAACQDACCKAIDDAGGVEVVTRAVREQRLIHEQWYQADPDHSKLSQAEASLRTATNQANQLGIDVAKDQEPGSYAARVKAQATDAAAQVATLRGEIDVRQRAAVAELVERARAGEESARAEVSNSAARLRAAFPPGFADAIHHAQFQGTEWAALVDELTASKDIWV